MINRIGKADITESPIIVMYLENEGENATTFKSLYSVRNLSKLLEVVRSARLQYFSSSSNRSALKLSLSSFIIKINIIHFVEQFMLNID
jgi:hypothetical protein